MSTRFKIRISNGSISTILPYLYSTTGDEWSWTKGPTRAIISSTIVTRGTHSTLWGWVPSSRIQYVKCEKKPILFVYIGKITFSLYIYQFILSLWHLRGSYLHWLSSPSFPPFSSLGIDLPPQYTKEESAPQ